MPNEENAIVLDYLQHGKSTSYKSETIAQVMGTEFFTLLEVVPKEPLKIMDSVYVGKEERDKIDYIKQRISYNSLSSTAMAELGPAIEKAVTENEARFVQFFNEAGPISIRQHSLELLPGLGKKHMRDILDTREKEPFKSYKDIEKRVKLMPDPVKTIVKRVKEELEEDESNKYFLFTRPPAKKKMF